MKFTHHVTRWITVAALLQNDCADCLKSLTGRTVLRSIRGGSDDEIGTDVTSIVDVNDVNYRYENSETESKDEMKHLRQQWSSIPAVPQVVWPFDIGIVHDEEDAAKIVQEQKQKPTKAIIIMDGFSPYHGQYLAHAAHHLYGAAVIHILSDFMTRYIYQVENESDHLSSRMPDLDNAQEVEVWKNLIASNIEVCGIYCESDSGLEDAERLGVALGLYPRCHDGINEARRNKYLMNEMVKESGLDTVQQKSCKTLYEAETFAKNLGLEMQFNGKSPKVVVKPLRGVASDDVFLCSDMAALTLAFKKIYHSPIFGSSTSSKHNEVLVQEFARGIEYAIDVVCRDGERKVIALWKYDKRPVNNAPFVYFSTQLIPAVADDGGAEGKEIEQAVCEYVFGALDALGISFGMHHVEVIVDKIDEKVQVRLVEVNCRQHNTDFRPLTNAAVGYNALDILLESYLGERHPKQSTNEVNEQHDRHRHRLSWDSIPTLPSTLAHSAIVHFVSFVEGVISKVRIDVLNQMEELESVMDMEVYPQFMEIGNPIQKTIDIRTDTGWAHLLNDDEAKFKNDYVRLMGLMEKMFEVE